jgi:hypothetical protein
MKQFKRSELVLDYLKVMGDLGSFNAKNEKHRQTVINYMENSGLELSKHGDDWVFFESKEMGIRAFFSNFPMNNKKIAQRPSLSIDFTGHYFIRTNAYLSARKMIRFFSESFGTFFKINRVDVRQDIYGAVFPFDYFPDFRDDMKSYRWALRGKPVFNQYNNSFSKEPSGFTISNSRYKIMSYNRNIALKDKLKKGDITQTYHDHYKRIYRDRSVQRLEISLKMDACKLFTILFMQGDMPEKEVLELTMANFGRNHALKNFEAGKALHKMPDNEVFSELFFLKKKDDVKYFKESFKYDSGISFSNVTFSQKGRPINEIIKMLAKKICEQAQGLEENRKSITQDCLKVLNLQILSFKDVYNDRVDRCKKSFEYMRFNLMEMMEQNKQISVYYDKSPT